MPDLIRVARKELWAFFSSPVAYIFLGAFLAVSLFVFFWVDTFFARNIADVRPLFEWMPLLLIFLVAALTMRLWSEERRAGTLETLMTLPVSSLRLVLGKFLASLGLVAVALLLTLPLPITVSLLGPLDWGPVVGGYVAALMLAAAYISIGLFVSARTDNAIVSLIGTTLVCGVFYLIGSEPLTQLLGHRGGELLQLLGTGSRFESITRGVIDLRDLYYYLSIVGVFLTLNIYTLERLRWAADSKRPEVHRRWGLATALFAANFLAGNLWLQQIGWARADITEGHIYSISDATRHYLAQLQEPLLIRGYFSAKTHPLLSPLVPQLRDLLKEYEIAGHGKVRVEFVDPQQDPEIEREANEKYGIRPVAFQSASKYQTSVVNSYFDILVQYGDQFEKLGFRDLIAVKRRGETGLDVRLRNPEYDITRAIKKVLYGYQAGGDLFQSLRKPVVFRGFISPDNKLPKPLPALRKDLDAMLAELKQQSGGKLTVDIRDPDAGDRSLAKEIAEKYGFQPLAVSLLNPTTFYFYMLLESDGQTVPIPLPDALDKAGLKRAIDAGLKRLSPGFLKTVALYAPSENPQMARFGLGGQRFDVLHDKLAEDMAVRDTDLKSGHAPDDADLLLVVAPESLDDKQVFAVDQFLMEGGTVVLAASPFHVDLGGRGISARAEPTGLEGWLGQMGVTLDKSMVLDPQNTPFPIPVERHVGGFAVQEVRALAYPYFPDIREDGMDRKSGITSGLGQLTLNWASPITVDHAKNKDRKIVDLLRSSAQSWTSSSTDIEPNFAAHGELGFPSGEHRGSELLAAVIQGHFTSYFKGKPSPLLKSEEKPTGTDKSAKETAEKKPVVSGVIDSSPASARLVLIGSDSFLSDEALGLAAEATGTRYLKPVQLIENVADWSLEDPGLLALRGRGQFSRMLEPMDRSGEMFWEYLNYALALGGLALVYGLQRRSRNRRLRHYREVLNLGRA
jgi:gliding motility-associated transport system permease protein/gliding motility-associatede transport system auxiliary component